MHPITLMFTYYDEASMLEVQLETWKRYPAEYRIVVVDDGSPTHPAHHLLARTRLPVEVYRIGVNLPWNFHGARNLGAACCRTDWVLMADIDMLLTEVNARRLSRLALDESCFYKFRTLTWGRRLRRPQKNTFLCKRSVFLDAGGYDEDYSGTYGGDGDLLRRMSRNSTLCVPQHIHLRLLPRYRFARPASRQWDRTLHRELYLRRQQEKRERNDTVPRNPLRFPWERVL